MSTKQLNKIAFIYHSGDADGYMSALLFADLFFLMGSDTMDYNDEIKLFPYNYEDELKFESELFDGTFTKIIFADCTPLPQWFSKNAENFKKLNQELYIFDHHKPKYDEIHAYFESEKLDLTINYLYDPSICAAKIIYNEFYVKKNLQMISQIFDFDINTEESVNACMELLNDYHDDDFAKFINQIDSFDTWKWWDDYKNADESDPYIYYWGLFDYINQQSKIKNLTPSEYMLEEMSIENALTFCTDSSKEELYSMGKLRFGRELYDAKSAKIVEKKGFCVVGRGTNPFITKIVEEKHPDVDFVIFYRIDEKNEPESLKLSLRSINMDFNVADAANKMFGCGGGHKTAAGSYTKAKFFFDNINTFDSKNL